MPVPADIEQILNKNQVEYGIASAHPNAAIGNTAKTTILQDSQGMVQVIHRGDSLIDVDALRQFASRELKACSTADIEAMCQSIQAQRLPAIPSVLGVDTIIDRQLLEANELTLDTGGDQGYITIDHRQFTKLFADSSIGNIAVLEKKLNTAPGDDSDDINNIALAVNNFTQLRVKQRLEETLEFPPLPDSAQRIIKLRVNPNADIKDLTDIVETDPALAAQVVSWAASPYYAAPGKIKSVHDAIVRVLGFDLVLNLSLGLALGKTLSVPNECAKGFTPYWQQAVYGATAVEALVGAIAPKQRPSMGMAYLSGLLHNFGYLILAEVFPPHFSNICRYQEANPFSNHSHIERHILGVTREQLGAWLMRLWNMPEEICVALRFQNDPDYIGEQHQYSNLLYIAMRLLRARGIGDAGTEPIPDALFERLQLDREKANEVIDQVLESSTELNAMATNLAA